MFPVEHRCACGHVSRPGQRKCRECHAEYMRGWRARHGVGSVLVVATIEPADRARVGDVATRIGALERIRNELDQALKADPVGVRRYHVALTVENVTKSGI